MTPEEERDLDQFSAALRGEDPARGAAARLGDKLRQRRAEAVGARDEAAQMRVWKVIDSRLGAASQGKQARSFGQRMRLAQAAGVFAIGIASGWFLRPTDGTQSTGSHLEFAYGDFERPRGSLVERTVSVAAPAEALHSITESLIAEGVPFELYSLGAGGDRRLVFTLGTETPRTAQALRDINIEPVAGQSLSLTFAAAAGAR